MNNESYFDGGMLQLLGWCILGSLITTVTLGICAPWALCMVFNWETKHTVVEGRRLKFTGTAMGLFGNWIKWLLLTIITLGIYSFWLAIALKKWKVKNTVFAD
jgi:Predicted membrane protein